MSERPVLAASHNRAIPSPMLDSPPGHEIALIYSRSSELDATRLAGSLRARGHRARLVPASPNACGEALGDGGPPLLLVATSDELDTPVLRSRLARDLQRDHSWIDRTRAGCGEVLLRQVCARMNTLRCEERIEAPLVPQLELAEPDAIGVCVEPPPARVLRAHFLVWPIIGALTAALGLLAFRPDAEQTPPPNEVREPAVDRTIVASAPERRPVAAALKPAPLPPPPPARVHAASPVQVAVEHERVTAADGVLVYAARDRPRDWYEAMNLCRGRTLAGLRGWKTPSTRQLHALAKQRALPPEALWSRTRSLHASDVAFIVRGHAGTTRRALKHETVDSAVCIHDIHDTASTPNGQ